MHVYIYISMYICIYIYIYMFIPLLRGNRPYAIARSRRFDAYAGPTKCGRDQALTGWKIRGWIAVSVVGLHGKG